MHFQSGEPTGFETATSQLPDGSLVLAVDGELDLDTAGEFKAKLEDAIRFGSSRVIVDLTGCDFVDSSGLKALLQADIQLNGTGPLTLIVPHANVLEVFEITHLDDHFVIHPTLEAALNQRVVMGAVKNKKLKRAKMAQRRAMKKRGARSSGRTPVESKSVSP